MSLTIESISDNIDINENLLTVKELLKLVKCEFNDLYIDKFWEILEAINGFILIMKC